jgi:hypothetical protein
MPLIAIENFSSDWRSIMNELIFLQAFIVVPATYFIIFRNLNIQRSLILFLIVFFYYLAIFFNSNDPLTKYNLLGLIPLSEPVTVLVLISIYHFHALLKETSFSNKFFVIFFQLL